jgi:hypothetical protein
MHEKLVSFHVKYMLLMINFKILMCQQISLNLPKSKFHGTALKNAQAVSWMPTDRVKHRDVLLKVPSANRAKL